MHSWDFVFTRIGWTDGEEQKFPPNFQLPDLPQEGRDYYWHFSCSHCYISIKQNLIVLLTWHICQYSKQQLKLILLKKVSGRDMEWWTDWWRWMYGVKNGMLHVMVTMVRAACGRQAVEWMQREAWWSGLERVACNIHTYENIQQSAQKRSYIGCRHTVWLMNW